MIDFGQTPAAVGGVLLGMGGTMAAQKIDEAMGAVAKPWTARPSTYVNVLGGLGVALGSIKMVGDQNLKTAGVVAGATMFVSGLKTVYTGMTQKGLSYSPAVFSPAPVAPVSYGDSLVEVR